MAQVKKQAVHDAILQAAFELFSTKGYLRTSQSQIAAAAGITTSNIYVYFPSKLDIIFALVRPWLLDQVDRLERDVERIANPRRRLERILTSLWLDIPAADNCFAHNIMQALATVGPQEVYSRELLLTLESRVTAMIASCLPPKRRALLEDDAFTHLVFMAFDGFVLNQRIRGKSRRLQKIIDVTCTMLLGRQSPAPTLARQRADG
ncbi:MAG TPA: TetR/AcrR family transcriptional regulator [Bradyrhizobium sp.]|nr:TetR/AcrR family transcriptional regulator [Bradyrhizobium sp.]